MEIRLILRHYRTFLFYFRKSNFNKKSYYSESEMFLAGIGDGDVDSTLEMANKLKKTYIIYCEELLHMISTYLIMLNSVMPVLLIIATALLFKYKMALLFLALTVVLAIVLIKHLNKKWQSVCKDYTTEITSINMLLNNNLNLNIDTDFDYLGEQYQFDELK